MKTPTVHNQATLGQIAETVFLAIIKGPLYRRTIFNRCRMLLKSTGMYGYTGWYKKRISVQGTGMGGPSITIYA